MTDFLATFSPALPPVGHSVTVVGWEGPFGVGPVVVPAMGPVATPAVDETVYGGGTVGGPVPVFLPGRRVEQTVPEQTVGPVPLTPGYPGQCSPPNPNLPWACVGVPAQTVGGEPVGVDVPGIDQTVPLPSQAVDPVVLHQDAVVLYGGHDALVVYEGFSGRLGWTDGTIGFHVPGGCQPVGTVSLGEFGSVDGGCRPDTGTPTVTNTVQPILPLP